MEFDVKNASGEPVRVTPVGSVGEQGRRIELPLFDRKIPAMPSFRVAQLPVAIGENRRFIYDWDDVILADILVEFPDRDFRIVTVDPAPTENLYHPTPETHLVIQPRGLLAVAPDATRKLGEGSPYDFWLFGVLSTSAIPIALIAVRSRINVPADRRPGSECG